MICRMQEYLEQMVEAHEIPGVSCAWLTESAIQSVYMGSQGVAAQYGQRPVLPGMYYDLASLTKTVGTTSRILQMAEAGILGFNTPVQQILERFFDPQITVGSLLLHNSGLAAEVAGKENLSRETILDQVYKTRTEQEPGAGFLYSDTGFILLGEIIRQMDGMSLEESFQTHVFGPLHMTHTSYHPAAPREWFLPTEIHPVRGCICGQVHDSKAYLLGESGSAGLFSTLEDLTVFAQAYLTRSPRLFGPKLYQRLETDIYFGRTWGWSAEYGPGTLYHTGFTGTSMLLDLKRRRGFVLLTNRIHPTRNNFVFLEKRKELNTLFMTEKKPL